MNFKIKKVYKFTTRAPSILGETYELMKVKSMMSSDEAVKYRDVHQTNNKLLPLIPGLPENADDNTYVLFEKEDGSKIVFAMEWIDENTIEEVSSINIRIDIPNHDSSDLTIIKRALLELGYNDINVYTY